MACPGCEELKPLQPVARNFGGSEPFPVIHVCLECAFRLITPDTFYGQAHLWSRIMANVSAYPLLHLFPQRSQAEIINQGVVMHAIESKEVIAFLKATVKEHERSDIPGRKALADRASSYLKAHSELAALRQPIGNLMSDIGRARADVARIETTANNLRNKLDRLAVRQDEIRRNRSSAALTKAMGGDEALAVVHDQNLANEIADISAVIQEADSRKAVELKRLHDLQGQLLDRRRMAFDARTRITHGSLMFFESRTAIALAELALVLKLSGDRFAVVIGSEIKPDPDAYEAMYDSVRNELADLLEG